MRAFQWIILVVILSVWLAGFLLDVGGSSIHGLLAVAIIVLCYFLITGRTSGGSRE